MEEWSNFLSDLQILLLAEKTAPDVHYFICRRNLFQVRALLANLRFAEKTSLLVPGNFGS